MALEVITAEAADTGAKADREVREEPAGVEEVWASARD